MKKKSRYENEVMNSHKSKLGTVSVDVLHIEEHPAEITVSMFHPLFGEEKILIRGPVEFCRSFLKEIEKTINEAEKDF